MPLEGRDRTIDIKDAQAPGGMRKQTWNFAGRATCTRCHNPWAQHTLAWNIAQLDSGQVQQFEQIGLMTRKSDKPPERIPASTSTQLVDPFDETQDIDQRARSYLHANCAHCHQPGAGGTANIDLRFDQPIEQSQTLGMRPMQGTFGIANAEILAPAIHSGRYCSIESPKWDRVACRTLGRRSLTYEQST